MDPSEIERLREKAREEVGARSLLQGSVDRAQFIQRMPEAVVGVGKAYSKRPTTVEGEMWRGSGLTA